MLRRIASIIVYVFLVIWLAAWVVVPFAINSIDEKLSKILKIMEGDVKDVSNR